MKLVSVYLKKTGVEKQARASYVATATDLDQGPPGMFILVDNDTGLSRRRPI